MLDLFLTNSVGGGRSSETAPAVVLTPPLYSRDYGGLGMTTGPHPEPYFLVTYLSHPHPKLRNVVIVLLTQPFCSLLSVWEGGAPSGRVGAPSGRGEPPQGGGPDRSGLPEVQEPERHPHRAARRFKWVHYNHMATAKLS